MKVPNVGESITEVTLSQWLVADGDIVELDQPICEFESDKATLEFPAEAAGKITFVASEDDDLEIGALVAKIDTSVSGGGSDDEPKDAPAGETKSDDKSPAPSDDTSQTADGDAAKENARPGDSYGHAVGHPSPSAGKMMRENDLSSDDVKGSGRGGRITKGDVQKTLADRKAAPAKETPAPKAEPKQTQPERRPSTGGNYSREERREKMSRMRRTIAKRLVSAKNTTAMLTTFNEVDLTEVMALRKRYQERFVEKNGIKLGFMSLFAKACAKALMEMPDVNAHIDGDHLVYHDYVDISIAISTPNGLVVPPVKNVESMSFADIEYEIKTLAEKARGGTLTLDEMQGGTFTITNGGVFGSLMSTPIINEPQSAILGMHTIQQRPMAIDGEVKIRPMMYLALSYDHRVIDGSTSVTFLVKVKQLLEDPTTLLLDL